MKRDRNELMLRRTDMITACINVDCIRAEPRTTHPSMIFFVVFTPLNWIKRDRDTEITIDVCRSFNTGQNTKWNICYLNGCHPPPPPPPPSAFESVVNYSR